MDSWASRLGWAFSRVTILLLFAWETPKTWIVDELVTAAHLNQHLRDNLNALKAPPSTHFTANQPGDYTTNQTAFVDVDATNLALTITTNGGDVFVHFHGTVSAASAVYFDVYENLARLGGDDGIVREQPAGSDRTVSFTRLVSGLAAGQHTFKLQWKVNTGVATLFAGAGTANKDLHPQFWAREIS